MFWVYRNKRWAATLHRWGVALWAISTAEQRNDRQKRTDANLLHLVEDLSQGPNSLPVLSHQARRLKALSLAGNRISSRYTSMLVGGQVDYPRSADDGLLKRAIRPEVSHVLGRMAGVLDRMVDFGTHLVLWAGPESAGKDISLAPPLMLLYHAIEDVDAASILIRRGSIDPCGPLLRSQTEATISAFYILQADTERRGLAYRYWLLAQKLLFFERIDPGTFKGKEALRRRATDRTLSGFNPSIDRSKVAAEAAHVRAKLANARFDEVRAAWATFGAKGPASWHSLFGGPNKIADMAERVGCSTWYDYFYRYFSDEVHSTSAMGSLRRDPQSSKAMIRPLRYPQEAPRCLGLAGSILIQFYERMIERFCPSRDASFREWYGDKISKEFMELIDIKFRALTA